MSQVSEMPTTFDPEEDEPEDWIRENRELIEREANSDAPDAWVFQRFLDSIDEDGPAEDTDGSGGAES